MLDPGSDLGDESIDVLIARIQLASLSRLAQFKRCENDLGGSFLAQNAPTWAE